MNYCYRGRRCCNKCMRHKIVALLLFHNWQRGSCALSQSLPMFRREMRQRAHKSTKKWTFKLRIIAAHRVQTTDRARQWTIAIRPPSRPHALIIVVEKMQCSLVGHRAPCGSCRASVTDSVLSVVSLFEGERKTAPQLRRRRPRKAIRRLVAVSYLFRSLSRLSAALSKCWDAKPSEF